MLRKKPQLQIHTSYFDQDSNSLFNDSLDKQQLQLSSNIDTTNNQQPIQQQFKDNILKLTINPADENSQCEKHKKKKSQQLIAEFRQIVNNIPNIQSEVYYQQVGMRKNHQFRIHSGQSEEHYHGIDYQYSEFIKDSDRNCSNDNHSNRQQQNKFDLEHDKSSSKQVDENYNQKNIINIINGQNSHHTHYHLKSQSYTNQPITNQPTLQYFSNLQTIYDQSITRMQHFMINQNNIQQQIQNNKINLLVQNVSNQVNALEKKNDGRYHLLKGIWNKLDEKERSNEIERIKHSVEKSQSIINSENLQQSSLSSQSLQSTGSRVKQKVQRKSSNMRQSYSRLQQLELQPSKQIQYILPLQHYHHQQQSIEDWQQIFTQIQLLGSQVNQLKQEITSKNNNSMNLNINPLPTTAQSISSTQHTNYIQDKRVYSNNKLKYDQHSKPFILIEDNIYCRGGQSIEENIIKTQTPTPIRKLQSKFFDNYSGQFNKNTINNQHQQSSSTTLKVALKHHNIVPYLPTPLLPSTSRMKIQPIFPQQSNILPSSHNNPENHSHLEGKVKTSESIQQGEQKKGSNNTQEESQNRGRYPYSRDLILKQLKERQLKQNKSFDERNKNKKNSIYYKQTNQKSITNLTSLIETSLATDGGSQEQQQHCGLLNCCGV